ncbi:MAG: hypothetical protein ACFFBE_02600 [Promethearchaeota archaeon]
MINHKYKNQPEIDDYVSLIENFQTTSTNDNLDESWKYHSYFKLVKTLERNQNKKIFTNNIILMLALAENVPPDGFNKIGNNINQISDYEKDIAIDILKNEFLVK